MNKGLFRKVTSLVLGFLLVFSGVLSGIGPMGKVKAAAGDFHVAIDLDSVDIQNAMVTFEFLDENHESIYDYQYFAYTGSDNAGQDDRPNYNDGQIPDSAAYVTFRVQAAGHVLSEDAYVSINNVAQEMNPVDQYGDYSQEFPITAGDELNAMFIIGADRVGGNGGGGDNPPPINGRNVKITFTGADEDDVWDLGII